MEPRYGENHMKTYPVRSANPWPKWRFASHGCHAGTKVNMQTTFSSFVTGNHKHVKYWPCSQEIQKIDNYFILMLRDTRWSYSIWLLFSPESDSGLKKCSVPKWTAHKFNCRFISQSEWPNPWNQVFTLPIKNSADMRSPSGETALRCPFKYTQCWSFNYGMSLSSHFCIYPW